MSKKAGKYAPTSELVSELKRQDVMDVESYFLKYALYWCDPQDALKLYAVLDQRSEKDKRLAFLYDYATSLRVRAAMGKTKASVKKMAEEPWERYLKARTAVRKIIQEGNI